MFNSRQSLYNISYFPDFYSLFVLCRRSGCGIYSCPISKPDLQGFYGGGVTSFFRRLYARCVLQLIAFLPFNTALHLCHGFT